MQLQLTNPICFFDLETTGLNVLRDRIVQIAIIKIMPDGSEQELYMLINPQIPISEESIRIHGITPEKLVNEPIFQEVGDQINTFIGNADLGGYNCTRFDIPMLIEEFARVDIDFDVANRRIIDVQRLFYKMEPRTLRAALKFYCKEELKDAHDAMVDVKATVNVLKGQLAHYEGVHLYDEDGNITEEPIKNDMQVLHDFTNDLKIIDVTQRLKYNDKDEIVFNFGKYIDRPVKEVFKIEPSYYHWILDKEFSQQVKKTVRNLYSELMQEKASKS